ncbi:hypothetical protein Patl1_24110 [Pistacia atlantica]|uniref:Uncharacterized protein n=1 Tax=Pistacia atlantica TaxID=434234 RepID=A0ACC1A0P2_9ROSI|nr:hypothetical protein Patl1_24110 [Pistacia atlantica]
MAYTLGILARMSLWKYGLVYRQGIGRGIGSYVNIQEDPAASADLAVVLMQEGLTHILLIGQALHSL